MDEQKERIELAPPNHGDGIVYEVNGKPVSKMTYHRHKSGKSETQRDTVREKKPHELAGYFSEGKKSVVQRNGEDVLKPLAKNARWLTQILHINKS
ncbi:hypothetical protein [Methylomonas koyamae]|uniref:hypothetical protein n=1 Tax=Methylomonas koyamae TaxID=702114 RepID=UPI0012F6E086|nr:hypothetical protein [Methylomonas koyamae]